MLSTARLEHSRPLAANCGNEMPKLAGSLLKEEIFSGNGLSG
jgi:hypothetical protein